KVVGALALVEELLNVLVFRDKEGLLFDPKDPNKSFGNRATDNKNFAAGLDAAFPFFNQLNTLGQGLQNFFKGGSSNNQPIQNNITLEIDGEKIGEVVAETQASKDAVRAQIYPLLVN
ncbi:MAG: hypothetical protein GY861_11700, partial [bacterium]|nr:hypothetical protein [bacterium]